MLVDRVPVCWMRRRTAAQSTIPSGCYWLVAVRLRGGYLPRSLACFLMVQSASTVSLECVKGTKKIAEQGTPPDMIRGGMICCLKGTGVDPEEACGYNA